MLQSSIRKVFPVALVATLLSAAVLRADYQAPKDGLVTDKQVTAYIQVTKEMLATFKAAGKAIDAAGNGVAAIGIYKSAEGKYKESLAKAGLTEDEFQWVVTKVMEARGAVMLQDMLTDAKGKLAEGLKKNDDDQAAARQKIAAYEAAVKNGRKVLSADERKSIVDSAKSDEQSALDEAKQHDSDAKTAADEAAKHDAEAKAADALAAKPPADVGADDRKDFIEGKKKEAEEARTAAVESRKSQAEAQKAAAESRAKATAAANRGRNPDVPNPDEAADVKKANDEALTAAKADLQQLVDARKLLADAGEQMTKQFGDESAKVAKANIDLVRKHKAEIDAIYGGK